MRSFSVAYEAEFIERGDGVSIEIYQNSIRGVAAQKTFKKFTIIKWAVFEKIVRFQDIKASIQRKEHS